MADNEVTIKTKIDESGVDKGLKSVKGKVNNAAKDMNKGAKATNALKTALNETGGAASGFANKMTSAAASGGAVAAGVTAAVVAAKKFIDTLQQANEAYKTQEKAEKALAKAAENNPYLNRESLQNLKDYASELQKVTNYGDEATIDVMAQLAATGRTEAEIVKIMGAAADYAAAKHIDLKSAAETLNSTFSGMSGTMGRQIAEIKDLTDEELKNGDAIDLIAKKYKGFASESADSAQQAKNAYGDFMESIGKIANPAFEKLNQNATKFWNTLTEKAQEFDAWLDYQGAKVNLDKNVKTAITPYTNKNTGEVVKGVKLFTDELLKNTITILENKEAHKLLSDVEADALIRLKLEAGYRERVAKYEAEEAEKAEKLKKQKEAEAAAEAKNTQAKKTADEYARESNQRLEDNLKALEVEAKAKGQAVSAQDRYNVYLQSYVDLLTKTNGTIKEGYPVEQKRLEQLKKAEEELKAATDAETKLAAAIKLTQEVTETINGIKRDMTTVEVLQKEIADIETLKAQIQSMSDEEIAAAQEGAEAQLSKAELINGLNEAEKQAYDEKVNALTEKETSWWDKHAQKQQEILDLKKEIDESEVLSTEEKYERMTELDEAYKQSKAAQIADLMTQINDYTSQTVDVINSAANLMLETSKNEAKAEQAALEEKYRKGEISEEEYNEKLTESKKKAAKEQYKIQMVQWGASILQATANIAQGVTQAIAQGGVAGLITGSLVAAAGAVQIASIIASKPTPPNFAGGGVIGGMNGASMGADNTYIHARTGEMVVNAAQQKALWEAMNGGANGAGSANIVINNSAANIATAQPKLTRDKIEIMIDARVNDSMRRGRYDQSMNEAQAGMTGDYYGI